MTFSFHLNYSTSSESAAQAFDQLTSYTDSHKANYNQNYQTNIFRYTIHLISILLTHCNNSRW